MRVISLATTLVVGSVVCGCGQSTANNSKTCSAASCSSAGASGSSGGASSGGASSGGVTVTVRPKNSAVVANGTQAYACTVTGTTNTACNWSVTESGGGTISTTGLYTAPAKPGTYHIVATSAADVSASDTATATVTNHAVGSCDSLPAAGKWENITPPQLNAASWCTPDFGTSGTSCGSPEYHNPTTGTTATYGAVTEALDPNSAGTVYLGTSSLGIWKTTNCGSTWTQSDTGTGGSDLDTGRQWTFVVDPTNSQILYTTPGYGKEGFYKSTDGGTNWTQMFTSDIQASLPYGGFIEKISMDPDNNLHLVVSFHIDCRNAPSGGHACTDGSAGDNCWACLAETTDGAQTWKPLTNNAQGWSEGDGQTVMSGSTWLYGAYGGNGATGGIWRTTDAGAKWNQVYVGSASGSVLTAKDGTYYVAGQGGLLHSTDGINWAPVANSPGGNTLNGELFIVDTGKALYASSGQYGGTQPGTGWYASAPDTDPTNWAPVFNYVAMDHGASTLAYDPDHKLLYSTNLTAGMWRVVLP